MSIFHAKEERLMTRSVLIALVVVLAAGVGVLAWRLHGSASRRTASEISISVTGCRSRRSEAMGRGAEGVARRPLGASVS